GCGHGRGGGRRQVVDLRKIRAARGESPEGRAAARKLTIGFRALSNGWAGGDRVWTEYATTPRPPEGVPEVVKDADRSDWSHGDGAKSSPGVVETRRGASLQTTEARFTVLR